MHALSPLAIAFGTPSTSSSKSSHSRHASFYTTTPSSRSVDTTPRSTAADSDGDACIPALMLSTECMTPVSVRRHNPYAYTPAPIAFPDPLAGAAHQPLLGLCEFVPMPEIDAIKGPKPTTDFPVYIGQAKFEATEAHVRWLIRRMTHTKVLPVAVQRSTPGCFVAYVQSVEEQRLVRKAMHHTVLYDHNGVWHPRTQSERQKVTRYMNDREFRMRGQRLPREMMTAELRAPKPSVVVPLKPFMPLPVAFRA